MSAMPIRAPRTMSMPRTRKHFNLVKHATKPIADAIPLRVPEGQASTRRFAYVVMGIFALGAFALLFVNILSTNAAFKKHELEVELSNLVAQQQGLERFVISSESPENLVKAAYRMGMVPVQSPAFIRMSDRKVLGTPMAASSQGR